MSTKPKWDIDWSTFAHNKVNSAKREGRQLFSEMNRFMRGMKRARTPGGGYRPVSSAYRNGKYRPRPGGKYKGNRGRRFPRLALRTRTFGSAVMMSKRKRRRMRRAKRGRIRRWAAFARRIQKMQYPPVKYLHMDAPSTITWAHNDQGLGFHTIGVNAGVRSDLFGQMGIGAASSKIWTLDKVSFSANITNQSPSITYVQAYWLVCINDTNTDVETYFDNDVTAGYQDYNDYGVNPISNFQAWRTDWRVVKKQFFEMEGGGVVKFGLKPRHKRYINEDRMNEFGAYTYRAGLMWCLVLRCWSQLVMNSDDKLFVRDNGPIGWEVWQHYRATKSDRTITSRNAYGISANSATTPVDMSDVQNQST